jgi:hypothetical protein
VGGAPRLRRRARNGRTLCEEELTRVGGPLAAGTTHWILDVSDPIDLSALEPLPNHPDPQQQPPPGAAAPGPVPASGSSEHSRALSPTDDGYEARRGPNGLSAEPSRDYTESETGGLSDGIDAGERSDFGDSAPKHRQIPQRAAGQNGGVNGQELRALEPGEGSSRSRSSMSASRSNSESEGSYTHTPSGSRSPASEQSRRDDGTRGSESHNVASDEEMSFKAGQNRGSGDEMAKEQGGNVVGDLVYTQASEVGARERPPKPPGTILKGQETKTREQPKINDQDSGSSSEGLIVHFNDKEKNLGEFKKLKSKATPTEQNSVTTSKYTVFNFLVLNLSQQFSRLANVYFLIIASLQLLTPLSPTGRFSTAAPLALVSHNTQLTSFSPGKVGHFIPVLTMFCKRKFKVIHASEINIKNNSSQGFSIHFTHK